MIFQFQLETTHAFCKRIHATCRQAGGQPTDHDPGPAKTGGRRGMRVRVRVSSLELELADEINDSDKLQMQLYC